MAEIKDIYTLNYMRDRWSYVGTLRNERRFNLGDEVFFSTDGRNIARGRIVGVELPPVDSPEYTYKVEIPAHLVAEYPGHPEVTKLLTCQHIFGSIVEAMESAYAQVDKMAELQRQEIQRFFEQFITKEQERQS